MQNWMRQFCGLSSEHLIYVACDWRRHEYAKERMKSFLSRGGDAGSFFKQFWRIFDIFQVNFDFYIQNLN